MECFVAVVRPGSLSVPKKLSYPKGDPFTHSEQIAIRPEELGWFGELAARARGELGSFGELASRTDPQGGPDD
jgi:hypothetical protein